MLQKFFILCSGADSKILETCSEGEQNKYAGIGATVFFTAIMACIASSYALYTVFDNSYIAIFFGLIWGLLIFNLDRFIVSTIKKRNSFFSEFLQATPRIILAVIIAIVISKPLDAMAVVGGSVINTGGRFCSDSTTSTVNVCSTNCPNGSVARTVI